MSSREVNGVVGKERKRGGGGCTRMSIRGTGVIGLR